MSFTSLDFSGKLKRSAPVRASIKRRSLSLVAGINVEFIVDVAIGSIES